MLIVRANKNCEHVSVCWGWVNLFSYVTMKFIKTNLSVILETLRSHCFNTAIKYKGLISGYLFKTERRERFTPLVWLKLAVKPTYMKSKIKKMCFTLLFACEVSFFAEFVVSDLRAPCECSVCIVWVLCVHCLSVLCGIAWCSQVPVPHIPKFFVMFIGGYFRVLTLF